MAIWTIPENQKIDYSPTGDDVDSFSQKVKFCLEALFETVQYLHSNGATAGLDDSNATPYEIRVNTADNCVYMRNGENTEWILLGEVAPYYGITPKTIGAVENGFRMGRLFCGTKVEMPAPSLANDFYFAYDESKLYYCNGSNWNVFLSREIKDILNYDKELITRDELTTTGGKVYAGKILRLDPNTGKANVDITGSPEQLCGYKIDVQNLSEGEVLAFDPAKNGGKGAFVNQPNYEFPFSLGEPSDGQILVYRESTGKFGNEDMTAVGAGKSLTFYDGEKVLGDYNGSETVNINLQDVLKTSSFSRDVEHLTRLVGNLYLALDEAKLNPSGYDGFSSETFRGDSSDIDTTSVNVLLASRDSDSLIVDSIDGLIEGAWYFLSDASASETVQIAQISTNDGVNRVLLCDNITKDFATGSTKLNRMDGEIIDNKVATMSGKNVVKYTTKIFSFINEVTGAETSVSRAHLSVKHDNIADTSIKAELALRTAEFVKNEVIAIGDGTKQTVSLAHVTNLTRYNFAVYFNGELQTSGIEFDSQTGKVTFTAPSDAIVTADYFYNWGEENFVALEKTGTYPDQRNPKQATTQFCYTGTAGTIATLRLTLARGEGTATNEIVATGTGKPQGFKLKHNLITFTSVTVTPSTASFRLNFPLDVIVVTAAAGERITVSYKWRSENFSVYSFACVFNE